MKNPPFFKFPVQFSEKLLVQDLQICTQEIWPLHFNTQDYEGQWTSIALRSASGKIGDITSFSNQSFIDTDLLHQCKYFQEVLAWFKCKQESVRLLNLAPNSQIKEHTDNDTSYEDGFFRIHIPIITNNLVEFWVNNIQVPMQASECWYANFQLPHSVVNKSSQARIHLVIDCIRNEWSDNIFKNHGFDLNFTNKNLLSKETKLKVIEELLRSNHETALNLANSMKKELGLI